MRDCNVAEAEGAEGEEEHCRDATAGHAGIGHGRRKLLRECQRFRASASSINGRSSGLSPCGPTKSRITSPSRSNICQSTSDEPCGGLPLIAVARSKAIASEFSLENAASTKARLLFACGSAKRPQKQPNSAMKAAPLRYMATS